MISNKFPLKLDSPRAWRTYTGGVNLDEIHGKEGRITQFPEEWIMSVVEARNAGREKIKEEGLSHIPEHGNVSLKSILEESPPYYLGERHCRENGNQPGVLVKLIDSAERLTVQVHPDREKAEKLFHSQYGKTECWHILGGQEIHGVKPCVYIGFKPGISRERWKHLFEVQDIRGMLECLHCIEVEPGDTILIRGGLPHAIGSGCFLLEIQEPTDYTIRVERVTPAGLPVADEMCHQGLGFEKMFECFNYEGLTEEEVRARYFVKPGDISRFDGGWRRTLIGYETTPLFWLEEIAVDRSLTVETGDLFSGIYVMEGEGRLSANGKEFKIMRGDQFFLPAGINSFYAEASSGRMRMFRFTGPK